MHNNFVVLFQLPEWRCRSGDDKCVNMLKQLGPLAAVSLHRWVQVHNIIKFGIGKMPDDQVQRHKLGCMSEDAKFIWAQPTVHRKHRNPRVPRSHRANHYCNQRLAIFVVFGRTVFSRRVESNMMTRMTTHKWPWLSIWLDDYTEIRIQAKKG